MSSLAAQTVHTCPLELEGELMRCVHCSASVLSCSLSLSASRHRCIGEQFAYLQLGTIISTFVRRYSWKLNTEFPEPNYAVSMLRDVSHRSITHASPSTAEHGNASQGWRQPLHDGAFLVGSTHICSYISTLDLEDLALVRTCTYASSSYPLFTARSAVAWLPTNDAPFLIVNTCFRWRPLESEASYMVSLHTLRIRNAELRSYCDTPRRRTDFTSRRRTVQQQK